MNGVEKPHKNKKTIQPIKPTQENPNKLPKPLNHSSNKPYLKNVGVRRGSGGLDRKLGKCKGHWVNGVGEEKK